MASRIKDASHIKDNVGLAPPDQPAAAAYERDFYAWLMEQARHVRDGHWNAIDRENLAEEIESLGREQFNKLESALRVLMLHMLKWDHQPTKRSRSWALSVRTQGRAVRQPQPKAAHRRSHRARLSQGTGRSREGDRTRRGRVSCVVPLRLE